MEVIKKATLTIFLPIVIINISIYDYFSNEINNAIGTDGDGIANSLDIDDDNDGLTDIIESGLSETCPAIGSSDFPAYDYSNCSTTSGTTVFTLIGTFQGIIVDMVIDDVPGSTTDCGLFSGCTAGDNGFSLLDIDQDSIYTISFYESGTSNPININWAIYLDDFDAIESFSVDTSNLFSYVLNANNGTTISNDGDKLNFDSGHDNDDDLLLYFTNIQTLELKYTGNSNRDICFSSAGGSSPSNPSCNLNRIVGIDTDGDGIDNHLDLDSDNDGIFDLDEAGHTAADVDNDGIIDGVAAAFGSNGLFDAIETFADSDVINYTISNSETLPDGTYDPYELDSDADGCFDVQEESIVDGDNDGIVGSGIPTVDTNGLVSSITYSSPINNIWQNPLSGPCLPEICNDGLDNDGDGAIDNIDSDCCDAKAPVLAK